MEKRRIALLGNSLILDTLGESLRRFPQNEVVRFSAAPIEINEIASVKPEVALFDLDSSRPQAVFSLLESCPGLILIGVSPDGNLVKMWAGQQLHELSTQDLLQVINQGINDSSVPLIHTSEVVPTRKKF